MIVGGTFFIVFFFGNVRFSATIVEQWYLDLGACRLLLRGALAGRGWRGFVGGVGSGVGLSVRRRPERRSSWVGLEISFAVQDAGCRPRVLILV